MQEYLEQFHDAMLAHSITPPAQIIANGKIHRFASNGQHGDDAGWYVVYDGDIQAGAFGCWRLGVKENWRADIGRKLTVAEEKAHKARIEEIRRARETEEKNRHAEVKANAQVILNDSPAADDVHPYLLNKNVKSYGLHVHEGKLIVPMHDETGELHSLQFIDAGGDKRFLTGGRVRGCICMIGEPRDIICIAEGYATAATIHESTGCTVAVAFNAGNLKPVAEALRKKFPNVRLIVCADDDWQTEGNPGLTKATEAARAVGSALAVPVFGTDRPDKATDFNDMTALHGAETVRHTILKCETAGEIQTNQHRFKLVSFDKIKIDMSRDYLVKDIIPREGIAVVYGAPKCGKTFLIIDMVLHIALGWEYHGKPVQKGVIVYIACEGERGLAYRIEAFRQKHMSEEACAPPFYLLTTRLDLASEHQELIADIRAQLGNQKLAGIVIDTLNRSLLGSENADKDMGAYIRGADAIREEFNCAVIIIHHCGLEAGRPRGHTSLSGAADAQISVKDQDGIIIAEAELMKDGESGAKICSRLEVVEIGLNEDGDTITSCVIVPAEEPAKQPKRGTISGQAKLAFEQLCKAITEAGEVPPANNNIPTSTRAVKEETWRRYCNAGTISGSDKPDAKRKAFKRAGDDLQAAGRIGVWNHWVWLAE